MEKLLLDIIKEMETSTCFLIAVGKPVELLHFIPPEEDEQGTAINFCFQEGREFAQSHPSQWLQAVVLQIKLRMQLGQTQEQALVSHFDMNDNKVHAVPYDIIRDKQKKIVQVRDTGAIVQTMSTFLPAFYFGMCTAHLDEQRARQKLEQAKQQWGREMKEQLKKRMNGFG